jgi:uncharacterized Zn-binding protein involved in type VI secretion
MGKPAARIIADKHACIANTAGTPHVGGPILPMGPFVVIGGYPAARVGDKCTCATGPPATIVTGSQTVLIGGKQAARMGDPTSHGGAIATGFFTVLIGG